MAKNVAILTSGGDAPGMNTVVRAVTYAALNKGFEVYGVFGGYRGLYENNIKPLTKEIVDLYANKGGTFIRTARLPEFKDPEVRKVAIANLKANNIDSLVVIGGDGSYMGAKKLSEEGISTIAIPGTIDNDISSSELTIGFDTSLNNIVDAIDKIKETGASHSRCMVVEVMGNKCDDLAIYSGIATGADIVISKNHPVDMKVVCEELKAKKLAGQNSTLVIVSEKLFNLDEIVKTIASETGWDTRASVLGHIQRGGTPTAMERVNATRFGYYAVKLLSEGITGVCVGLKDGELVHEDNYNALKKETEVSEELLEVIDNLK